MIENKSKTAIVSQAVPAAHELSLWLIPQLDQLPRQRRDGLGARIESCAIDVLEALIEATYSQHKHHILSQANRKLELLRHLWRLCYELEAMPQESYEHGTKLCNELGRQIGGWMKSVRPSIK